MSRCGCYRNFCLVILDHHWQLSFFLRLLCRQSRLLVVLCVDIDDLLYFVVTAKEDTRSVVDGLGYNLEHTLHLAVDGLAASYHRISR